MTIRDWLGRSRNEPANDAPGSPRIDPETGEILDAGGDDERPEDPQPETPETATTVRGERTIPSVNSARSIRTRVTHVLAIATAVLLAGGFFGWYYAAQFSKAREASAASRQAAEQRAAGEMRVPPLGRVDPPTPQPAATPVITRSVTATDILGPEPPPPPVQPALIGAPAAHQAPPPKTPQQLALERKLGQPVLLRGPGMASTAAVGHTGNSPRTMPGPPLYAQAPRTGPGPTATGADADAGLSEMPSLSTMLRATPMQPVAAQLLPTRRLLLPKGAFIDCTLETAIDSTYDGMVACIGASDIYGADGKVVLLERGTKYVGEKRGEIRQGQGRVFVLWHEARTPTGVVVNLASPGTDELGRAGLPGHVDTHFWDRFGAAILISVIDGAIQALAASQQRNGGTVVLSPQGSRDILTEVLKGTIAIPPTVIKNQGDRIQVLVARDVDFRTVYALRSEPDGR